MIKRVLELTQNLINSKQRTVPETVNPDVLTLDGKGQFLTEPEIVEECRHYYEIPAMAIFELDAYIYDIGKLNTEKLTSYQEQLIDALQQLDLISTNPYLFNPPTYLVPKQSFERIQNIFYQCQAEITPTC